MYRQANISGEELLEKLDTFCREGNDLDYVVAELQKSGFDVRVPEPPSFAYGSNPDIRPSTLFTGHASEQETPAKTDKIEYVIEGTVSGKDVFGTQLKDVRIYAEQLDWNGVPRISFFGGIGRAMYRESGEIKPEANAPDTEPVPYVTEEELFGDIPLEVLASDGSQSIDGIIKL